LVIALLQTHISYEDLDLRLISFSEGNLWNKGTAINSIFLFHLAILLAYYVDDNGYIRIDVILILYLNKILIILLFRKPNLGR
jgi:hypothetical protein